MITLGLTGSIGMGKTTAARLFRGQGVPVFDADRCVHELYEGPAVDLLAKIFPSAMRQGRIDRNVLGALVLNDPEGMAKLESIVHPLVLKRRIEFLRRMRLAGARMVVVDVPLLFETGGIDEVDAIIVVTASAADQRERVLARAGMSEDKLTAILERQVPDAEKRKRAHFIVQSRCGIESTKRQIRTLIACVCVCERINIT